MFTGNITGVLPLNKKICDKLEMNNITDKDWIFDYEETGMCFSSKEKYDIAKEIIEESEQINNANLWIPSNTSEAIDQHFGQRMPSDFYFEG
jgi:hypothetical protein